jgi:NitT/TauT family transport system substrate-binding protein
VLDEGPTLGEGHQRWMMNEINKLIWPNENGIGIMDEGDYDTTVQIATDYDIVKNDPGDGVYTTEYAEDAVSQLEDEDVDVKGEDYEAPEVEVTEGGQ